MNTVNPHLQVASDSADQVGGRPLSAALRGQTLVSPDVQQQHFIQHHLPQLRGKLCDQLQTGGEELPRMSKVLEKKIITKCVNKQMHFVL